MDGTGVHCTKTNAFDTKIEHEFPVVKKVPVKQDREIAIAVGKHLNSSLHES